MLAERNEGKKMSVPMKTPAPQTIEDVITKGDLSKLTPQQRTEFYVKVCNRHGLDPLTQPFDWLVLNGRLTLYANRRCADQLRKINGINISIVSQDQSDGLLTFHVKAKDGTGREDEDLGVVALPDTLKGEARANTILKAVTKAKRRVTLSISGLGYLDETEVENIPASAKATPEIIPPSKAAEALIDIASTSPAPQAAGEPDGRGDRSPEGTTTEVAADKPVDWKAFGETILDNITKHDRDETPEQKAMLERMKVEKPRSYANLTKAVEKAERQAAVTASQDIPQPQPEDDPDAYRMWFIDQISRFETVAQLDEFFQKQRPLWESEKVFPPDIEDWEILVKERAEQLG